MSNDLAAMYSPKFFKKFAIPSNNRIFKKYDGGLLHNCGPHPAIECYLEHNSGIYGLTCDCWDLDDSTLRKIKVLFDHKAILYVEMRIINSMDVTINEYKHIVDILAPDVTAIPWMWIGASTSLYRLPPHIDVYWDTPILYNKLLKITKEYADKMKKG